MGIRSFSFRAGGLGIEPRLKAPKASVLPLDDPPALNTNTQERIAYFRASATEKLRLPLDDPPMFGHGAS